jgi:hypothetical protein
MKKDNADKLIIPIYINEKIVLDMLAILDDGFSMVSQVNYTEHAGNKSEQNIGTSIGTSATLLSKLLKIDLNTGISHEGEKESENRLSKEKVHTNVSLLSKFRSFLVDEHTLKTDFTIEEISIGDFIEIEGELQKNPLINCLDIFADVFRLADIFTEKPQLGEKTKARVQKQQENETLKQINALAGDLKHSGTIDFILTDSQCTAVLSAQEQYLANDNISEMLGGRFKVLGKVIAVCRDENDSIDLLRKTTLSILPDNMLDELVAGFKSDSFDQYHFPKLITKIAGPAVMVIPVAIYA